MRKYDLKPCPFCRGKAELVDRVYGTGIVDSAYVYCTKCKARSQEVMSNVHYCADEKAVELWNTRVEELSQGLDKEG